MGLKPSSRSRRRGTSLVELALVLPIFLLMLRGVVDLSRALGQAGAVTNAARQGARYAITNCTDATTIKNRVIEEGSSSGINIDSNNIAISPTYTSCTGGQPIKVTVTYNVKTIMGSIVGLSNYKVVRSCQMAIQ